MADTLNTTPRQDGFYVPGAWQHKKQCWMIWPEQSDTWMRDSGPNFIIDDKSQVRGVDWEFNFWGGIIGGLR